MWPKKDLRLAMVIFDSFSDGASEMFEVTKMQKEKLKKDKFKRKLFQYSGEALQAAMKGIREDKMAIREASRIFSVPKSTLHDRLLGKISEKPGKTGPEPLLSVDVEKKIAEWAINLAKCGFPIKRRDLIETVEKLLRIAKRKIYSKMEDLGKDGT